MSDPRRRHWEQVYRSKSSEEVSWFQSEPAESLRLIRAAGVGLDAPIIDVGGGASVLIDRLLDAGFRCTAVLDVCAQALATSRARLGGRAAQVEWLEADVTAFRPPHGYALWHDRAVFHFLTEPDDRNRYKTALRRALLPDGQVVIATFAVGGPARCSGLDIVQYDARRMQTELGDDFVLEEVAREVHVTPAGKEQKFEYFRLRRTISGS